MANNYGVNDSLSYLEIQLDSRDAKNSPYQLRDLPITNELLVEQVVSSDWPLFVLGRPLSGIAAVKILEVQVPFSYYVISQENASFILSEQAAFALPVTLTPVHLTVGNYTATTLIAELSAKLTAASQLGFTYVVTYDTSTGRLTTTVADTGPTAVFKFIFGDEGDSGNTNPRLWLGFNQTQQCLGGVTTTKILVAPNCLQITGPNYLYLNSTTLGSLTTMYLPTGAVNLGGGAIGPQLCKFPVNCQPGGVIYWQDPGTCCLM